MRGDIQARRRGNLTVGDRSMSAAAWAKEPDVTINSGAINRRIRTGWDVAAAIFTDRNGVFRLPGYPAPGEVNEKEPKVKRTPVKAKRPDRFSETMLWVNVDPEEIKNLAGAIMQLRGVESVHMVMAVEHS